MEVFLYGELAELAGHGKLTVVPQNDTEALLSALKIKLPGLEKYTFLLSVNQEVVSENKALAADDEIALLPPFSGG